MELFCRKFEEKIEISSVPCNHRSPKIIGGSEAANGELPFMVSLTRRGGHFCGASILNEQWLVTAGHCVCNGLNKIFQISQIQGVIGLHSISQYLSGNTAEKSAPIRINFKSIIPHPKYECTNVKNDIALLQLDTPMVFTERVKPICVSVESPHKEYENQLATVSGWGWTNENQEEGPKADVLKKVAVKIWNNNSCEKSYKLHGKSNSLISDTQLCAGLKNGGADSCWADSGGPLIMKDQILVGIVSTGIGCARPGLPGIYTRVSKYVSWIESVLR
ncbi:PREDICTED: transmembrane protease serine 9 [Rhagoletis zephyria]|uniref:transmembrane protease serine 9 n=1 Tax=Rhagoletis zephyria TaxID=28612 RepID=UPI0008113877|nr:PREDICTED: transmembrane protease serine 9 [Rhagoletis zephyria]